MTTDKTTKTADALAAIDDELEGLLARRRHLLESAEGFDAYAHERRVAGEESRWRAVLGDGAPALVRALIASDRSAIPSAPVAAETDAGTAVVIGGGGRMGAWMARFLHLRGWDVTVADPAGGVEGTTHVRGWADAPQDADLVVVAAPLRPAADLLADLAASPPTGLVFDIGSLKSPLRTGLLALRAAGARVTSVHPMFGPDVTSLHGRHVIVCDVGDPADADAAAALFKGTAASLVRMGLEEHDRVIAYILGLSHALNIAFVTAVAESGEAAPRLAELSSTTFDAQLGVAGRVVQENPHLYFEIQRLNDYGIEALAALSYAVEKVRSVVRAGDEEGFVRLMAQGRRYVDGR